MITKNIINSPTCFAEWCSKLQSTWALDTECTSLKYIELEIIGFSICDGKQACYVDCTKNTKEYLDILEFYINEAKMIVFHNFAFDGMVLKKYGIEI